MTSMASFLVFALVFTSQLINGGFSEPLPLPSPSYGNHTSILGVDGSGIRRIIPAVVVTYLDKALKAKDPTTSLVHYFDVISGTSTGGIMTVMLTAPSSPQSNIPLFDPSEIIGFYKNYGPQIFAPRSLIDPVKCPKYDGRSLRDIIRSYFKETRLNQTLTNAVITSFDEKKLTPVIFSNFKLKTETYLNAYLSDISISTSAAPTYFPPHQFTNFDHEFDLVDGAMAANNPALAAVSEVIQHSEHKEILLLSLGTGIPPTNLLTNSIFDLPCQGAWLVTNIDVVGEAIFSTNMIHYYLATVFPGVLPFDNYLRIEEYNLDASMGGIDDASTKNMNNLENAGKNLLLQKVKRVNVNTFIPFEL